VYLRSLKLTNIRAIERFELAFAEGQQAGWHVLLGANGAGKSSVIRSLALVLAGPREAAALRTPWDTWVRRGSEDARIDAVIDCDSLDVFTGKGRRENSVGLALQFVPLDTDVLGRRWSLEPEATGRAKADRSAWGTNSGWFAASFGPFRRFTGGDREYDRLFLSNPRLAPHLSAFGEDVALTEGLRWLRELRVQELESASGASSTLEAVTRFMNASRLLPHGATISEVTSSEVKAVDGSGTAVAVEQLSDGYRSVLSMIFEIMRQMARAYGTEVFLKGLNADEGRVELPGIIAIDEVDAHLHPSWQNEIGPWFTRCFPKMQFIVTTHSPIVCRAANSIWRLAAPGSDEPSGQLSGADFGRLTQGTIIDAYGTELFGRNVAASATTVAMQNEVAQLNRLALRGLESVEESERLRQLQRNLPTVSATLAESD
jgi:hypothetical protein